MIRQDQWLVAVFDDDERAHRVPEQAARVGIDPRTIRIGDSLDTVVSRRAELGEDANGAHRGPLGALTSDAVRGATVGAILGVLGGSAVTLPLVATAFRGFGAAVRLTTVVVGIVVGGLAGSFVATSSPDTRPETPVAADTGVTLAVPDSEPARWVLLRAVPVRVDLVLADGLPVETLLTNDVATAPVVGRIAHDGRREQDHG